MITTAVFVTQTWRHSKYPSAEEWINNFWYIHAVKYYSSLKRKKTIDNTQHSQKLVEWKKPDTKEWVLAYPFIKV